MNGLETHHSMTLDSQPSYIETCTLPDGLHSFCIAALDNFVLACGSR